MSLFRRRPPASTADEGTTFGEGACTLCRSKWTAWSYEPQLLGTAPEYGATIYRCGACGAYWEEGLTYPHTIAREEAMKMLPWLADEESAGPETGDRP